MKKQSNLNRLLGYAGKRKILTYLSWIFSAASALIALLPFWYIWRILKDVIEAAPDFGKATNITHYGWMAVLFAVLAVLVYVGALMCSHLAAFRIATNLRIEMTNHIATLPLGKTEQFGSGKLRRIISETSGAAETYLAHQLPDQARAIASVAGLLALLFIFDWKLGLLSLAPVALGFVCMQGMTGKNMQRKMTEYQNALSDMSNEAVEYVRGIPVVKTFGQSVFSFKKFKATIDNYEKWTIAYTKQLRGPMTAYTLAINSVFAFLILGGYWFSKGEVTNTLLLDVLFYIIITPVISLTLTKLMHMSENKMLVEDAITRIDSVLNEPSLSESSQPKHPKDNSVELKNVTFSYDGTKNALSDISLRIGSGQTVAFVGPSGGGKSTLASIAARFFDPQSGNVLIGGVDAKEIGKEELMNTVSFVFQNSKLIKASILDNVRLGKPDATEAEVMSALRAAQCMDIIEKFPQGVNTVIGSKGVYLSGGEAQRIAVARAMLKNAPIIILDEATAFADPDNETKVQAAFNELAKGRTVIMIAHRLSTVTNADKIFVLSDGEIAESGTFDELTNSNGLFAKMWNDYKQSVQWKVSKEA
ncbi:MAG TPA: ABC transporter ATP-binding protein [Ruminococcaceae bacterium]|nr:ABC transporter ATP-binding protein [Oscillospiraceae bacterium]